MRGARIRHGSKTVVVLAATAAIAATVLSAAAASATPSSTLVINEVYGGGGNTGATLTNDFIELANRGDAAVSLDGWSVQYHSGGATGSLAGDAADRLDRRRRRCIWSLSARARAVRSRCPRRRPRGTIAMSATAGHRRARAQHRPR